MQYCVGCAVHRRVVRGRAREARKFKNTGPPKPYGADKAAAPAK